MRWFRSIALLVVVFTLALLDTAAPAQSSVAEADTKPSAGQSTSPRIAFVKEFPGSVPDYYSVSVAQGGEAIYSTAPDDPKPVRFKISPELTEALFHAAERLDNFKDAHFETKRRVASMGKKTLRYEGSGQRYEASFNYSDNPDVMVLAQVFEKIGRSEQDLVDLDRATHYDRLGVNAALAQVEMAMNRRELVEAQQFAPVLEAIAGDSRFLNIARQRAGRLLDRIRSGSYSPDIWPAH